MTLAHDLTPTNSPMTTPSFSAPPSPETKGDGIVYNQRKRVNLGDLVQETLELLETHGGGEGHTNRGCWEGGGREARGREGERGQEGQG